MKRHLAALFAVGALAIAAPTAASAQDRERGYYGGGQYGWGGDNDGYYNLRRQFQHAYDGVRHGLRDGSFTRSEARYFYRVIGDLRQRLDFYRNNDGYLSRREARDMNRRLAHLHDEMHEAHDIGHEERDHRYDGRYGDDGGGRYGRDRRDDD